LEPETVRPPGVKARRKQTIHPPDRGAGKSSASDPRGRLVEH
jgi:hypothetical protein